MGFLNIFLILVTVGIILYFALKSAQYRKKRDDMHSRFFEEEEAANSVRKKEIDEELFYTPNLNPFPKISEDDPFKVKRCASRKMIRFPVPMTNLELKKQYGPSQLDLIALYEENFNEYLKSLTKWAHSLENKNDAIKILETVVSLGGEFRDTYRFAMDIYTENNDKKSIENLRNSVQKNHFKDPAVKQQILDYINGNNVV